MNTEQQSNYDRLIFSASNDRQSVEFCYVLDGPGTFHLKVLGSTLSLEEMKGKSFSFLWPFIPNGTNLSPGRKFLIING